MNKPEINYFFDIDKFEKNNDGGEWNFTLSNGTQVRQFKTNNGFVVETTPPNSAYVYSSGYNEKGEITITGVRFYDNGVKKWIYFNDKQEIIKEIDNDQPYLFSIEALAKLLKENYGIDLYDTTQISMMSRYVDTENLHKPIYIINANQKNNLINDLNCFLIDGETGKVLFQMETYLLSESSVYDEYIKTTEEYKNGTYKLEN
ncbi:hypothetical protein [Gilliamella apis]|uniref:Uncharacterized protein n=1 Tax=Gilliamella apis TaxID=1970738 RepID=A0A242NWS1_9GAMM|nr:hypothetical protein [Gilliamella apis]OTQ52719.1 hypothetical protein B6D06_01730 [Gilliamella apis]